MKVFNSFFVENGGEMEPKDKSSSDKEFNFELGSFYSFLNSTNPKKEFIDGNLKINENETGQEVEIKFNYLRTFLASLLFTFGLLILISLAPLIVYITNPDLINDFNVQFNFYVGLFFIVLFFIFNITVKLLLNWKIINGLKVIEHEIKEIGFSLAFLIPYYIVFGLICFFIFISTEYVFIHL